jgi:hypothetical protein
MNADVHFERRTNAVEQSSPSGPDLVEDSRRLGEDFVALAEEALHVALGWRALLRRRLERRPYATLAVAAGVGYVLGGGVPSTVVRTLIGVGGRIAVEHAIARLWALENGGPVSRGVA